MSSETFTVAKAHAGLTLAKWLRWRLPGQSWSAIRRLVATRHVKVGGELCLDPARRLAEGQTLELLAAPVEKPRQLQTVVLRHIDAHVVIVEKPTGIATVRHPAERNWSSKRKALSPVLEDLVSGMI